METRQIFVGMLDIDIYNPSSTIGTFLLVIKILAHLQKSSKWSVGQHYHYHSTARFRGKHALCRHSEERFVCAAQNIKDASHSGQHSTCFNPAETVRRNTYRHWVAISANDANRTRALVTRVTHEKMSWLKTNLLWNIKTRRLHRTQACIKGNYTKLCL